MSGAESPDVFLADLVDAIATVIVSEATRRSYEWHRDPSEPYVGADAVGLYDTISPGSDDATRSVAITAYDESPGANRSVFVQFKIRTRTTAEGAAIEADLYDLFEERPDGILGTIELAISERTSGTSLGQIGAVSYVERVENYRFDVHRPTPHSVS